MSSPGPGGGVGAAPFRPIGKAAPVSKRARDAANNTRDMGLKVFYTLDDQTNTMGNCLARWPDLVSVRTAAVDEKTVIGVVALRISIQAVLQSSPELVSKVGQDYTVYAYDYSEPDVPQSGQGMLSWALSADTSQLVTGRVSKNMLGLFSNGVEETLEVKLRLVPVSMAQQNGYMGPAERSIQQGSQSDNEWNTLVNSQPGLAHMNHTFNAQTVEEFNNILNPLNPRYGFNGAGSNSGTAKPRSRASTPTARGKRRGSQVSQAKPERPSSAAPGKRPRGRPPKIASGNVSGSEDLVADSDDGPPAKKRVRPSEAERDGASTFGDPESLRIQASTAASIRGDLRPKPVNPAMNAGHGLQELPRAPTPVPKFPLQVSTRTSNLSHSSLRQESLQSPGGMHSYASPYPDAPIDSGLGSEQIHLSIESAMTSPERRDSPAQTPQDITSSPPVLTTGTPFRSSIPPPSSPILPQMPRREDSAYGGSGGLFGEEDEDDDICLIEVDGDDLGADRSVGPGQPSGTQEGRAQTSQILDGQTLPAHKSQGNSRRNSPHPQKQCETAEARRDTRDTSAPVPETSMPSPPNIQMPVPTTTQADKSGPPTRAASLSSVTMPSAPSGDSTFAPPTLARSQTAAPQFTEDRGDSEIPTSEPLGRNVAKKTRIISKLQQAIANGQLPDYCSNCGAIETPTWRKAFTQDLQGDPGFIEYSDEPGQIMAVTILARDDAGKAISYRIFKKSLAQTESFADFKEVMLCNPCGLWVTKYKSHRPKENWEKKSNPVKKPRVRGKRRTYKNQQPHATSEAPFPSEPNFQSDFQSEANFPQSEAPNTVFSPTPVDENENATMQSALGSSQAQPGQPIYPSNNRPSPTEMDTVAAANPAGRSSPNRAREGSRHSPIQLEPEYGTTRRLLFPSPRKDGSPKSLGEPEVMVRFSQAARNSRSPRAPFTKTYAEGVSDKENRAPTNEDEDSSMSALFGEESPPRPKTPTRPNFEPNPFKTPTRPTPSHKPITRSQSKSMSAQKSMLTSQSPSRTPSRTPRRSPRHHPDVIETPMTYINRIFSQPDLQINLAALEAENTGGFGDATDFSMPDVGMNFDMFEDNLEAGYIQADEEMWNNIQYDILGGHGEPIHDNEELVRILGAMTDNDVAMNDSGNFASGASFENQGKEGETAKEVKNDEGSNSIMKENEEESNGEDKKDDTKTEEAPQM